MAQATEQRITELGAQLVDLDQRFAAFALTKYQWRGRLLAVVTAALMICVAMIVVLVFRVSGLQDTISAQSVTSCEVQSRGLAATPHLTAAMKDLATLVTPTPGEKVPPGKAGMYAAAADLRKNLNAYVAIQAKQPPRRDCTL